MARLYLIAIAVLLMHQSSFAQQRYDVVIDEIMADPSPVNGLPNAEWIELVNTSSTPINIHNWRIGDNNSQSGPMPSFILQPDSFIVICGASAVPLLSGFTTTIHVSGFPSLDNENDVLYIKSAGGLIIHSLAYSDKWYRNEVKRDGGWSLEMIDTRNPCTAGSNWKASEAVAGGTPGKLNSVTNINSDHDPPTMMKAFTEGEQVIIVEFDEPLDSISVRPMNFNIDGGLIPDSAIVLPPLFRQVKLKTNIPMKLNTIYTLGVRSVKDCSGNMVDENVIVKTGIPSPVLHGEWIINEILFDPHPSGYDYVEFYNAGNKIIDAATIYIANRNTTGQLASIKPLTTGPHYIFPGEYYVVTADLNSLSALYPVTVPAHVLELLNLPSFPDDKGTVVTLDMQGNILDEVHYDKGWHFNLLLNTQGVAIERIDPSGSSNVSSNWHSAAATSAYGTPTAQNSQYRTSEVVGELVLSSGIISPDNDGRDDFLMFNYRFPDQGFVANVTVYNIRGSPVCYLLRNSILGTRGSWSWDGLDNNGLKLPAGIYIIRSLIFNLEGQKKMFRNVVVMAGPLN